MKTTLIPAAFALLLLFLPSCDILTQVGKDVMENQPPSTTEMVTALKQSLEIGTGKAVDSLHRQGGYLNNPLVRIPFPPEAQKVAQTLRDFGMGKLVDDFVMALNRGAEEAAKEAAPIFVNAIKDMTVTDARNIVLGSDTAATNYFRQKTYDQLADKFQPQIKTALDNVYATKYWADITTAYNRYALGQQPIETDLSKYVTGRALDGLFLLVKDEEARIRENPAARVTEVLDKVFGWADKQKSGAN